MLILDIAIVNVALPSMQRTLGLSAENINRGCVSQTLSVRNAFAVFLVLASLVLFILSLIVGLFNLTLYGAPAGVFFAAGCIFMVLAIFFRVRRTR